MNISTSLRSLLVGTDPDSTKTPSSCRSKRTEAYSGFNAFNRTSSLLKSVLRVTVLRRRNRKPIRAWTRIGLTEERWDWAAWFRCARWKSGVAWAFNDCWVADSFSINRPALSVLPTKPELNSLSTFSELPADRSIPCCSVVRHWPVAIAGPALLAWEKAKSLVAENASRIRKTMEIFLL